MSQDNIELINSISNTNKDIFFDPTVVSAIITITGMIFVSLITIYSQKTTTEKVIDANMNIVNSEFYIRQKENWLSKFLDTSSDLLFYLDPEHIKNNSVDKDKNLQLIHRMQILLNLNIKEHKKVNNILINLALKINGETSYMYEELLTLHGSLSDSIREITSLKEF